MGKYFVIKEYSVGKTNKIVSIFILIFIWFIFFTIAILKLNINLSDYSWSSIFVSYIILIYILRFINKISLVSLYSLFSTTLLLFIGGRFLSIFLGYKGAPLFEMESFSYNLLDSKESTYLIALVILGFIAMEIGMYLTQLLMLKSENKGIKQEIPNLNNNLIILYIFLAVMSVLLIKELNYKFAAVISGGYIALYQGQIESYSAGSSILSTLLTASTGVYLSQNNKRIRLLFISLLGVFYFFQLVLGVRGGFISYLLLLVWYYYGYGLGKLNVLKFLLYVTGIILILTLGFQFISFRGKEVFSELNNLSVIQRILSLLYDQGITLMVFNESMYIDKYPISPYFQNFIPGTTFFFSNFVRTVSPNEISFASYLSYSLNQELFSLGFGLGWSLFSDAFLYGIRNPFMFSLFLLLFSIFINFLQLNINRNIYIKVVCISLVIPIMILPRAGLNSVIPLIPYILLFYYFVRIIKINK